MRKYFGIAILLISLFIKTNAQKYEDSLRYYNDRINDTSSLNKLINYCFTHIDVIPDLVFEYSQKAVDRSKLLDNKSFLARGITNLGAIEANRGNYSEALKYYLESLDLWAHLNNRRGILLSKNDIAQVYGFLKKPALEYQFLIEAETIATEDQLEEELGIVKTNLSIYYANIGNFRNALKEQLAAIEINKKFNKFSFVSLGYSNAGAYLFYLNKLDSAIFFYTQSKKIGEAINDKKSIALSFTNLAEAFNKKGLVDSAIVYYKNAIIIAKQNSLKDILAFSYESLAEIYKTKKDFSSALKFVELKQLINDSILNIRTTKQLVESQTKYETAKKEQIIQQQESALSKKNYLIASAIVIILFATILVFMFFRNNKIKQTKKMQDEIMHQQDLSTTAVIQAEEKERKRIAGDLHDGIGQIMSAIRMNLLSIENGIDFKDKNDKSTFEKINSLVDEGAKELRMVSHNMMPNTLLKSGLSSAIKEFIDKIDNRVLQVNIFSEGLNERIDSNIETVLYRVIQESVNNVIKHAQATMLEITLINDGNGISATIEDDGKGFAKENINENSGLGIKNIQSRVAFLKGTVEWDTKIGNGTVVVINIPTLKPLSL